MKLNSIFFLLCFSLLSPAISYADACKEFAPLLAGQKQRQAALLKRICPNTDCTERLEIDWERATGIVKCLTLAENILIQDYTRTYGSLREWDMLTAAFARLPKLSRKVFRGTPALVGPNGQPFVARVGAIHVLPRFVSTSLARDVAERFARGYILEIKAKSARDIRRFATLDEQEHILLPGTRLRIDKISKYVIPAGEEEGQPYPAQPVTLYSITEI